MMRVLIYGGSSFIGKHLTRHLLKHNYQVAHVDRTITHNKDVKHFQLSNGLTKPINQFNPNYIIYLSASYGSDVEESIEVNVTMPLTILESLKNNKEIEFIYTSSYWLLGNKEQAQPINIYACAKKSMSDFLTYYHTYQQVNCKELLLYGTYGDRPEKLLDNLISKSLKNKKLALTEGKQKLNLVHIDNLCNAIIDKVLGSSFNKLAIYSDKEYTPKQLVELINSHRPLQADWGALPYRDVELMTPIYSDRYKGIIIHDTIPEYIKTKLKSGL